MPLTYFLKIDGIAGDSTSPGHQGWFEVASFSFGESNPSTFTSSYPVSFPALDLALLSSTALAALLAKGASGTPITAIEIEGVTTGAKPQTVYDLTLNNVRVSSAQESASSGRVAATNFSFDFGKIGVVTTSQNPDGSLGAEQTFGWDLATSKAISAASLAVPTNTTTSGVPNPVAYFLKIDGIAGDSTSPGHQGWFEVASLSFGESNSSTFSSAGKVNFSDLHLMLSSNTALTALLAKGAGGTPITAIEIEGVTADAKPQTVYDLTLNNVRVSSAQEGASSGGGATSVSFNFGKIGVVTTSQNPDGSLGAEQAFGWDLATSKAISPASLAVPTNTTTSGVPNPAAYFLKIDGIAGDSTSPDHKGWFEVASLSFGESNSSTFSSAGIVNFSDLNLTLFNNTALTALLAKGAGGTPITALEIEGVTAGAKPQTVYDLTLNNVRVSSAQESASSGGGAPTTSVSFNFGKIGVVTTSQNPDGSPGADQTFGWDLATNKAISSASLAVPTNTTTSGVPDPVAYFLKIDGIAGDSTSPDHKGWFEVASLFFGESNTSTFSSAGKVNFSDLHLTLFNNTALTALLAKGAGGTPITAIEIEGVTADAKPQTVHDLTLNDVRVSSAQESASSGGGATSVSFNFGKIGVVTTSQNPDGSPGAEQTFGWDLATSKAISSASLAVPTNTTTSGVPDPAAYFLKIDGIAGDSTSPDHKGWFEVESLSFGESNSSTFTSSAPVSFSDLHLTLSSNTALTALLAKGASGTPITALEIEGVTADAKPQTVYDLTLNNVRVSSAYESASAGGGATSVSFNFGKIGVVTTSQNPDGSPGAEQTFGWDLATSKAISAASLAVPTNTTTSGVPDPAAYFLKIDGIAGNSTSPGHQGWFEVASLSLGEANSSTFTSAGTVTFAGLTLLLFNNTALTPLLAKGAGGTPITAIEIEGVTAGAKPQTVYDLTLNNVLVSSVQESAASGGDAATSVSFNFGKIGVVTTSQNPDGTPGAEQAFGWDLTSNKAISPASLAVPDDELAVAQADAVATAENAALTTGNVFINNGSGADSDADGPALSVAAVNGVAASVGSQITLGSGAHLTLNANGTFNYDPNHAFDSLPGPLSGASNLSATDTFTYTLTHGSTATVTVTVSGVDSNDTLRGTAGADTLNGGAGTDTAGFSGPRNKYLVQSKFVAGVLQTIVTDSNASGDGIDTLTGIEKLAFSDGTRTIVGAQQNNTTNVDGDRFNDVLFQNDASGQIFYEKMVDGHAASGNYLTNPLGTLRAAGSGHIDPAVGTAADVLVQDVASGTGVFGVGPGGIYYYSPQDAQPWHVVAWSLEDDGSADPSVRTTSWTLGAVVDVNGDGTADAVIQSTNKGAIYYMPMVNGVPGAWGVASYDLRLADTPGSDYLRFAGAGDVNADGFADVVVRNASDGTVYWGDMAGGAFTPPWHQMGAGPLGADYKVVGVGDVNGDGHADVIVQLQLQGPSGLNGWTLWGDATETNPANTWKQVTNDAALRTGDNHTALLARSVVDLNNDGYADVVFQNSTTGDTKYWDMNPTTGGHFTDIGTVPGWHVI